MIFLGAGSYGQALFQKDTIKVAGGDLVITFIGHSSLLFYYQEKYIYIDPVAQVADFSKFPKADALLVTHDHGDHFDTEVINLLQKPGTELYLTGLCHKKIQEGKVIRNDDFFTASGVPVEAVPAYNIISKRGNGIPYHPKGDGNGYVLTFGKTRVYVAGDTELTPEMLKIKSIDILFLPVAEPYTMSVAMAAQAAAVINPKIFYPYHLNKTNPEEIVRALFNTGIEIRLRNLK